ncbi:TerD family protein [Streptomyces sp. NPDC017254]|uniref:TerD family protein n=1 Tax=unclassified Streptomyces TaxID=2593676 RepID=UPI0037BA4B70
MSGLIKGDNAYVPTVPLRVAVRNGVDVAALLVTEQGRVRGDGDIVFHGAPVHPSGAVVLTEGEDGTVWLETGLTAIEEAVSRVLVVASTENGALRDVDGLSVEAFAPDGTAVVRYAVTDAGGETAMVLAELYRRAGGWKFRAVGQGYLDGLEGLAVDHGVDVADEAPAAVPAPAASPAPAPAPTPTPDSAPASGPATSPGPAPADAPAPGQFPTVVQGPPLVQAPPAVQAPSAFEAPPAVQAPGPVYARPTVHPQPGGPAFAPPPGPAPLGTVPLPVPEPSPPAWTFGSVFEPRELSGRQNDVISEEGLPPGPVLVELAVDSDGYTGLWPLDRFNKEGSSLVNSTRDNFRGRLLTDVPKNGRLRLKLRADGPWRMRILPLSEARLLAEDTLECEGPDVLLHTGGTADAAFHYRGDSNFIVYLYELADHDDPTTLPEPGSTRVNEIGRRQETVPLPEGPLLVHLMRADGPWRARLKHLEPHSGWVSGGWAQGAGTPVKQPELRRAQGWLRRRGR